MEELKNSKMLSGPNTGCFFKLATTFGREKIGAQKIKKQIFSQDKFYPLKAHTHYFTVLIYLAT